MKKILIGISAVVMSFGLFADSETLNRPMFKLPKRADELPINRSVSRCYNNNSYAYAGVHVLPLPLPMPGLDIGYRFREENIALDGSIGATMAYGIWGLEGQASILKYHKKIYQGLGVRTSYARKDKINYGAFGLQYVLGYEWKRANGKKCFTQLEIKYPNYLYFDGVFINAVGIKCKYCWSF